MTNFEQFEKHESDIRSYCRSFPVIFKQARGAELITSEGKHYIDFLAGAGTMVWTCTPVPRKTSWKSFTG